MNGDIRLLSKVPPFVRLPNKGRITNILGYAGNQDTQQERPWVITEDSFYEIQNVNGEDQAVPIPLKEISALIDSDNGRGACVNDVYIYFNMGNRIERYFNRNMDDVGPDKDAGLPSDRQGVPRSLLSYPGRVYAGIDGGTSNYSSVLARVSDGWHEAYRAPRTGLRIRDIYVQSIPGSATARMWISQYADILWAPVSIDPFRDGDYRFHHEGVLYSSWHHAGMQDVVKQWKSIKLFLENSTAARYCKVDYQTDDATDDDAWTAITDDFYGVVAEENFSSSTPPSLAAKRLRYRLRMYTQDNTESPRMKAAVIEATDFLPDKYGWNLTFSLRDEDMEIDYLGNEQTSTLQTIFDQLKSWRSNGTALTMRTISTLSDSYTVFIDSPGASLIGIDTGSAAGRSREKHVGQISVSQA